MLEVEDTDMIKKSISFLAINILVFVLMFFLKSSIYKSIGLNIPNNIIYLSQILVIMFSLKMIKGLNYKTYNNASVYGSHGTSRFQSKDEAKRERGRFLFG